MLNKRRKILFYTHALTGGGAERVVAVLASGMAARGHDVTLAVDFAASENAHMVDPSVKIVTLGASHVVAVIRLALLLAREQPDVALGAISISNLKLFLAALFSGKLSRVVLGYHGYSISEPQFISRIGYAMTPLMTRLCAATVCVSDGLRRYVIERWFGDAGRTRRIYNPVSTGPSEAVDEAARDDKLVLAGGRLVDYKNVPLLIRAFAKVEPRDARLVILGQGPCQKQIDEEIARCGLQDRVTLAGYVPKPWDHYRKAGCFVLSSDSESFGLVVVEAMAHGASIVSTDCDGPREILADGRFGRLTPCGDEDALAAAISATLAQPSEPALVRERARDFSTEAGLDRYGELIEEIAARNERSTVSRPALAALPAGRQEGRR